MVPLPLLGPLHQLGSLFVKVAVPGYQQRVSRVVAQHIGAHAMQPAPQGALLASADHIGRHQWTAPLHTHPIGPGQAARAY